jgi:ADP-heptose:LPS heptosyltransferase
VPSRVLSHDVPCRYCYRSVCPQGHHDCLRLVTPESVARAAGDLLSARSEKVDTAMELS